MLVKNNWVNNWQTAWTWKALCRACCRRRRASSATLRTSVFPLLLPPLHCRLQNIYNWRLQSCSYLQTIYNLIFTKLKLFTNHLQLKITKLLLNSYFNISNSFEMFVNQQQQHENNNDLLLLLWQNKTYKNIALIIMNNIIITNITSQQEIIE